MRFQGVECDNCRTREETETPEELPERWLHETDSDSHLCGACAASTKDYDAYLRNSVL